jgi:hypothetical protein
VQFHISKSIDDVLVVSELDSIRLPLSLGELLQLVTYLGRLYSALTKVFAVF